MVAGWRGLAVVVLVCGVALGSCSDTTVPPEKLQAVTLGPAASPALDALSSLIEVSSVSDASADLLVADGDANEPGTLAASDRVRAFLAAGKPVLFLDNTVAHAELDLVPLLHGANRGESHAVLARRTTDRHGRPEVFAYAFPGNVVETPSADQLDAFRVGAGAFFAGAKEAATDDGDFDPPPGLLYVLYNFSLPPVAYEFTATKDGTDSTNGTQWTSLVSNYRFILMLENGKVATGDRQFVVSESSAEASPLNSEKFSNKLMITKTGSGFVSCDIGWFQVEVDASAYPQNQQAFQFQTSSPQNANQVTTVNSRISFGINFMSPKGVGTSFGYQSNDSTNLTAWEVVNGGNGSVGRWMYKNQNPWIWDEPDKWTDLFAFGHGVDIAGSFLVPNTLARDQIQAITKIVWATDSVVSMAEPFSTATTVSYLNVWAPAFGSVHSQVVSVPQTADWMIDMAAVVPIPIGGVSFAPNPVDPAVDASATGTVELEAPAAIDTVVYLSSDSDNAIVPPTVTVLQGETSAAFQVAVNENGLSREQPSTVANVTAFDALTAQGQLTITRRR